MTKNTCHNCNNNFNGDFCNFCGQGLYANKRLKFKDIIADFLDNTFNLHRGFFFTFWQLMVRPEVVVGDYIKGRRKRYTNPTRYLVIALAIQGLINYLSVSDELLKSEKPPSFSFLSEQLIESMHYWQLALALDYGLLSNAIEALMFPVGFYLLFRALRYSYTELLVASFYFVSNSIFIAILTVTPANLVFDIHINAKTVMHIIVAYYLWAGMRFFKQNHPILRFLKLVLAIFIFIILRFIMLPLLLGYMFPIH
ncbi:DUF3667 domain-containing protein [Winogradskyella maritima]|uniref:DUF3667 domain-containing protein n=1 Tax=Winogradskyella maritima TaxID=1517766 RepID=A0ABV8AH52_9FLAO|nr:DUF3667 domain-containing protein [Winogradskyella maritima]